MIIPVFIPHGGCPERCSFCDQRVSGGEPLAAAAVTEAIEARLNTSERAAAEIAFYGGTFTALPRARQLAYLEAARPYLEDGRIGSVRIATRPDALDEEWLGELKARYRLETVELGAQSFNPRVLAALGRSHTVDQIFDGVALLEQLELRSGLHLMIGSPREDEAGLEDARAIEALDWLRPAFLRIHPLLVLKGTTLEAEWRAGAFVPPALDPMVERAARLTEAAESFGIRVIRLGLQANELLGEAVLAGAYHPAFGDLVRGRVLRNRVATLLARENPCPGSRVELLAPERLLGPLRGPSHGNLSWIKTCFNLSEIGVSVVKERPEPQTPYGEIEVRIHHSAGPAECRQVEPAQ